MTCTGGHHYRHEQGCEEVAQPPFKLAVNLISLGNSFVRWLAEMDAVTIRAVAFIAEDEKAQG
jgi:hypothetical protein